MRRRLAWSSSDLVKLLWGNGVSTLGTSVYLVAVLLLLKDLTQSALVMGLFQFMALIPGFLLSPLAGVMIDRSSRRSVIIVADVARGIVMILAGLALMVPALRHPATILAVSFVVGAGNAFFVPAVQALIPDIVPRQRLQRANGLRAGGNQLFNLTGNAVGGFLYTTLGAPLVFLLNGVTFLLSALQETRIAAFSDRRRHQGVAFSRVRSVWSQAREGLTAVLSRPHARVLFLSQAGLFLLSPALLLALPFIVIDEMAWPGGVVGLFFAISIAGGVTVFLIASRVSVDRLLNLPAVPMAYFSLALVFFLLGVVVNTITLVLAAFTFGAAAGAVYLYTVTWIQARNDAHLHGRLFALLEAGNSLVAPISYVATGFVLELLGPAGRYRLFLLLAALALVWALRMVPVRTGRPQGSVSVAVSYGMWYPEDTP